MDKKNHQLLHDKKKIIDWLNQYEVFDFELINDSVFGYKVNVNNNVSLTKKELKKIEVKFGIVRGYFSINYNDIKSLWGCPDEVYENFSAFSNKIESLKYLPQVGRGINVANNKIKSLKFSPEVVNSWFSCERNELTNLKYVPKIINGGFSCYENKISTLLYFPEKLEDFSGWKNDMEILNNQSSLEKIFEEHQKQVSLKKLNENLNNDLQNKSTSMKIKL